VTGATLSSHQSHDVNWNCQDINGNTVADGWYRIRCEYTTRHAQGPVTPNDYIKFYKGENAIDTTFNDFSYNGQLAYSNISLIYTPDVTILEDNILNSGNSEYILYQNYPNSFNPQTTIIFEIPNRANKTRVVIYNSIGQKVKKLFTKDNAKGIYQITWNGMDDLGNEAPSGVYYVQLITGLVKQTRKMFLLR
jgi:flagellar hook assembly protein FlgD